MKIIKCVAEKIKGEIRDAETYIDMAIEWKEDEPDAAEVFADLADEELGHMERLHKIVTDLIAEYRNTHGEPSAGMMELYNYMHAQDVENTMRVKVKKAMYNEE